MKLVSKRDVDVYFAQTGDTPDGVVGLLAKSVGQRGGDVTWTNDNAGNGGSGGSVALSAGDANLGYATSLNVGVQPSGGQLGTSAGILVQSIGGHGGVQQTTISTNGVEAIGISAQSIGGVGGSAVDDAGQGQSGGTACITIDANSVITTASDYAIGMLAQSIGGGGGIGGDTSNGPFALGWADGDVSPSSGQVSGDISFTLGGGGGGIYTTGESAYGVIAQSLSAPKPVDITVSGRVFIGKTAGTDALRVTGNFTQSSRGELHVATDFVARATDLLSVDGHAKLGGKISVVASTLMPNRELIFLQAGDLTPNATMQGESELFTYRSRQAGNALAVSVGEARFNELSGSYGVGSNLHALGQHLQDIWDRGSAEEFGVMYAALNRSAGQGRESYSNALKDLSPGVLAAPAALKQADMESFSNSLMSCPSYIGTGTRMGEHDCVWGRITGNTTRMDGTGGTSGLKSNGVSYQIGAQRSIAPNWFVGAAGAYENRTIRSDERRQRIEGDTGYLGVSLKYENGPWTFAGALTGSVGSFDNTRSAALMGAQATSDSHVTSISQRLRASYTHAMPSSYIKPFVDLDVIQTRMSSFDERGAGALNLHVDGVSKWTAIVTPSVEFGGHFDLDNCYTVRPYASVGVSLSSADKWDTRARFANAPNGTDLFTSTLETGRVFGQVSAGIQLLAKQGTDVRLQYDGLLSNKVSSHSASLKASWKF